MFLRECKLGRTIKWTEARIAKAIADGYGQGVGANYKPWLEVQMLSSQGVSHRACSLKTGRPHHLLSNVELALFLALDWQQDIVDIREQYPLDRDLTRTVALELGIRHPCYPDTHVPTVMTVDFLVTRLIQGQEHLEAFNAKTMTEAENPKSLEKLEIQRAYFAQLDIPHHLVFDMDIPKQQIENLRWINDAIPRDKEREPYAGYWDEMAERMDNFLRPEMNGFKTLGTICDQFDADIAQKAGTGIRAVRILMAKHFLVPELDSPDLLMAPVTRFHMAARAGTLRVVGGRK